MKEVERRVSMACFVTGDAGLEKTSQVIHVIQCGIHLTGLLP